MESVTTEDEDRPVAAEKAVSRRGWAAGAQIHAAGNSQPLDDTLIREWVCSVAEETRRGEEK